MQLIKIKPLRQEQPAELGSRVLLHQRWQEECKAGWCRCQLWWCVSRHALPLCAALQSLKNKFMFPPLNLLHPTPNTHTHTRARTHALQTGWCKVSLTGSLWAPPPFSKHHPPYFCHCLPLGSGLKAPPSLLLPSETQLVALPGIWASTLMTLLCSIPWCQERSSEARPHPLATNFSTP